MTVEIVTETPRMKKRQHATMCSGAFILPHAPGEYHGEVKTVKQEVMFLVSGLMAGDVRFEMELFTEIGGVTTIFSTGIVFDADELAAHWHKMLNAYMVDIFTSEPDNGEIEVVIYTQRPTALDDLAELASQLRLGIKSLKMAVQGECMMRITFTMCEQIPF